MNELQEFIKTFKSVNISSLSIDNKVLCSYAPIIFKNNEMFILISEVAKHFANIKNNPNNVEIMFLEDECKAASIFARKRLSYQVNATIVDDRKEELFEALKEIHGNEVEVFKTMLDFHFIKLEIKSGRFVKGFGKAYDIDTFNNLSLVNTPHKTAKN